MKNKAIERIKEAARKTMSDNQLKHSVELDTDADEDEVEKLIKEFGDFKTTRAKSKWCRWDLEGFQQDGQMSRIEVKSRTYGKDYDTWIIDSYKMTKLLEKFPNDRRYFVNVFEGEYHLFDGDYVASCPTMVRWANFKDGSKKLRTLYVVPKDMFIVELSTGELGKGYNETQSFIK